MKRRERFFTALELREPDYVPITDLELDPPIVEAITQKRVDASKSSKDVLNLTEWESSINYRLAMVEACRKLDFDAVVALSFTSIIDKKYRPKFIDEKRFVDQWGLIMQTSVEGKTTYYVGGTVNTPEDLENYEPPDAFDPERIEMMEKTVKPTKSEDVAIMGLCTSGWHLAFEVRGGIDKLVIDSYRNPSFAEMLISKIAEACQRFAEAMIEVGVDVLIVADDYADSHGPLISPQLFRKFALPHLKKMVDIGKKHGIPVLLHSDGNLYPILDDIVNTGIKGLHPIEPGAMDLADVKERYGNRICLFGNVDCRYVLPYGNEESVRKDVRRCIDAAGKGGGFILTSSNTLHANVKIDNIYVMVDEARKYGRYPFSG